MMMCISSYDDKEVQKIRLFVAGSAFICSQQVWATQTVKLYRLTRKNVVMVDRAR